MPFVKAFARNHPIKAFLTITFLVSYPLGLAFNFFVSSVVTGPSLLQLYLPRLVTVLGPAIAALCVAGLGGGPIRVGELLRACRVPLRFVAVIAIVILVSLGLTSLAFMLAGVPPVASGALGLAAHLVIQIIVIGFGEELGWRGWLLPTLSRERGFARATALAGLVWIVWHAPVFFSGPLIALAFIILLSSLSILYAWLWRRCSGSVGVVAAAHGAANAGFFFLELATRKDGVAERVIAQALLDQALLFAFLALTIVVVDRRAWTARLP